MFFVNIVNFLRTAFLKKTSGGCCWQSHRSTVKSAMVFLIWFRASTSFRAYLEAYEKRCTNNYLLSRDKTMPFLIELIYHVLSTSKYVLEKH